MSEQLDLLVQLQEIDHQRNLYKEAQERLPQDIEDAQKPLRMAQENWARAKTALEQLIKERKGKEKDLQIAEEKLEKLKSRLTELKTNKEYQAHLNEIEASKGDIGKVEEELLLLMERGDLLKKEVAQEEGRAADAERVFSAEKVKLESRLEELRQGAEALQAREAALLDRIDSKLLQEYRQLASIRKGAAVVPLENSTCSGCHFSLPPQVVAEVRKQEKVLTCTYCRRILYWRKGLPSKS